MDAKITLFVLMVMFSLCKGLRVPKSAIELQKYYGNGTSEDISNVFYKYLAAGEDLPTQAANQLKQHLEIVDFDESHIDKFLKNMKLISETEISETDEDLDLEILRNQLYHPDDFMTELLMEQLLYNIDNGEQARQTFDDVFLKKNANRRVQLYRTDDEDIFNGVIIAAERKQPHRAVYLVFVVD